jgi:hypothetical protein
MAVLSCILSIMPLFVADEKAEHVDVDIFQIEGKRSAAARRTTLLLLSGDDPAELVASRSGVAIRILASLGSSVLDHRLADGYPPESSRLLAARAQVLVSRVTRQKLADSWENVIAAALRPPAARYPKAPLNRGAIVSCAPRIAELCRRLSARNPIAARGVAMSSLLLADGTGPVHNRRLDGDDLDVAIEQVLVELDPLAGWNACLFSSST